MRIDKLLSQLKYCTRSETKRFLNEHVVLVNQKRISHTKEDVDPTIQSMTIDDTPIFYKEVIHLMMYKPKGYLSANKDSLHPCAVDLIQDPYDRYEYKIAGRLDLDAEGLLILTTSGILVHGITSPRHHLPKIYEVLLDKAFDNERELLEGVPILDGKNQEYLAKALSISYVGDKIHLTIDEGKFHQVKRMFEALGYNVINLKRVQIGKLKLGNLKPGMYLEFNEEDLYD